MVRIWLDGLSVAGRSTSPPNSDGKRRRESRTGSSVISEISDVKQGQNAKNTKNTMQVYMVLLQPFRINVAFPLLDFFLVPSSFCFFSFSCQHFQGQSKNEQEGFQVSKCIEYLILTRNMYSLAMSMRLLKALAGRKWVQHV